MVRAATSDLGQFLAPADGSLKYVTLGLCAAVLPIWRKRIRKRVAIEAVLQASFSATVAYIVGEGGQTSLCGASPKDATVLLARAGYSADAGEHVDGPGGAQSGEHEVQGLEPHGDGGVDLASAIGGGDDALGDGVGGGKVGIEVDLGLGDDGEGGVDDDGWGG